MRRDVRVLFVGDGPSSIPSILSCFHPDDPPFSLPTEGVGKSTIITSVCRTFFLTFPLLPRLTFCFAVHQRCIHRARPKSPSGRHHSRLPGGCDGDDSRFFMCARPPFFDLGTLPNPDTCRFPFHTARPADRAHLDSELRKAHVIVIVYSIDHSSSFDRMGAWWLPYIRAQGVNVSGLPVDRASYQKT